jgi:hypothetical protein
MNQIRRTMCVACGTSLLFASTTAAQVRGTASLGVIGQQTSLFGAFWPGFAATAGFGVRVASFLTVRAEGEVAGFPSGGSAQADCIANAECLDERTPWGIGGGSALVVLRHDGFPLYAGAGLGAWRSSEDDRVASGPAFVGGLTLSSRRQIAVEARFNRPSTAMGLVTSTVSLGLRFAP